MPRHVLKVRMRREWLRRRHHASFALVAALLLVILEAGMSTAAWGQSRPAAQHWVGTMTGVLPQDPTRVAQYEVAVSIEFTASDRCDIRFQMLGWGDLSPGGDTPDVAEQKDALLQRRSDEGFELYLPLWGAVKFPGSGSDQVDQEIVIPGGMTWRLWMRRSDTAVYLKSPPFPQVSEAPKWSRSIDVRWTSEDGATMEGSLYLPPGDGPFPVAVVVWDRAASTRALPRRVGRVLASALAGEGVATFLYDDRGVGRSMGDKEKTTLDESVADVHGFVKKLMEMREVDGAKVHLVGMGEGAVVVAKAAADPGAKYASAVLLAYPTTDAMDELMKGVAIGYDRMKVSGQDLREADRQAMSELGKRCLRQAATSTDSAQEIIDEQTRSWFEDNRKWDAALVTAGLKAGIDTIRQWSPRSRSAMADAAEPLRAMLSRGTTGLVVFWSEDGSGSEVERIAREMEQRVKGSRVVRLAVTRTLVDDDRAGGHPFDVMQVISPQVLEVVKQSVRKR